MTNKNLILTRKQNDKVVIHKNGKVLCLLTITSVGSNQCKLGFQADSNIKIDRKEIFDGKLNKKD